MRYVPCRQDSKGKAHRQVLFGGQQQSLLLHFSYENAEFDLPSVCSGSQLPLGHLQLSLVALNRRHCPSSTPLCIVRVGAGYR